MAREYEGYCLTCNRNWYYNDADLREAKRHRNEALGHGAASVLGALGGNSAGSLYGTERVKEAAQGIVNYEKCPFCGSENVATNASEVDNWLLDDPSSPLFAGGVGAEGGQVHSAKSKVVAALLAILLGWCGAHKFYLGYAKEGAIMLCVSAMVGSFIPILPGFVMALVGVIEGIIYLTKDQESFSRTYVLDHKGWF